MKIVQFQVIHDEMGRLLSDPDPRNYDRIYALTEDGRMLFYDPTISDAYERWSYLRMPQEMQPQLKYIV
jgi:hypothetical protein